MSTTMLKQEQVLRTVSGMDCTVKELLGVGG